MIRVVLVDDQRLVRAGLRMLCEAASDVEVVGEAENGHEAVRIARQVLPDVVLMDLSMPGVNGFLATERILGARPTARIVVLTTFDDDDHLYPALRAGACGFLVKDAAPAELLDGIRKAAAGESPFSAHVLERLVASAVDARPGGRPTELVTSNLTAREREVLALVAAGLSNSEIADRLCLGVTTVKTHIANLMTKTAASNRVRLAVLAVQSGIGPN